MAPIGSSPATQQHWKVAIDDFRSALSERRFDAARSFLSRYPLHFFYHLEASEMIGALESLRAEPGSLDDGSIALNILLNVNHDLAYSSSGLRAGDRASLSVRIAHMVSLRLRGRHQDAYEFMLLKLSPERVLMRSRSDQSGSSVFFFLQNGLTSMLIGESEGALGAFEDVWWQASIPGLEVITRDALAKAALVHATFGNPIKAKTLADRCKAIDGTDSWAEQQVEATLEIVDGLLCLDASDSRDRLGKIEMSHVGEMWPFYVQAEYRALDSLGSFAYAAARLAHLDKLALPFTRGEGYSGSVLPLMMALNAIAIGDPSLVRKNLADCDRTLALTGIVEALLFLQVGAVSESIARAMRLREKTRSLRRLELWRISILGEAYLAEDNESAATLALRETTILPDPLSHAELSFFSKELRELGEKYVQGWPKNRSNRLTYMDHLPRRESHLTEREVEVVRGLSHHMSRRDLAEALYVSPNTLKSQLRSIYRKLGVTSREEAIHEAVLRGLI